MRLYVVAGAQHLGGTPTDRGLYQHPRNPLNDRPFVLRAMLAPYHGSYLAFPATPAQRQQTGDPRPSVAERYPTREAYLARATAAVLQLQEQGLLLHEDAVKLLRDTSTTTAIVRDWAP